MKTRLLSVLALVLASCSAPPPPQPPPQPSTRPVSSRPPPPPARATPRKPAPPARPNPIAESVNRYRVQNKLPAIPVSPSLSVVAARHVADLEANYRRSQTCNMHSWSSKGDWTPCCYTADHARKECMWNKPKEITGGVYSATGYEIVAWYSDPITPAQALEIWRGSPAHHAMILNRSQWSDNTWRAMGAASSQHYAAVWFGEEAER